MKVNSHFPLRAHYHNNVTVPSALKTNGVSYLKLDPPELIDINKVRVVLQKIPTLRSAGIDVWIGTGSAHETDSALRGISHFNEHIVFKGTKTRSNLDILHQTEGLGGYLNAFTGEEYTCYYTVSLGEFSHLSLEVLLDMVQNPKLDESDIETEKKVIIQEIKKDKDTSTIRVLELANEIMFGTHPYGIDIAGNVKTVKSFNADILRKRLSELYTPQNTVVSVSGNFDMDAIASTIEKMISPQRADGVEYVVPPVHYNSGIAIENRKDSKQANIVLATQGISLYDSDKYVLKMIDIALGSGMISRLSQEIREKRGLAYTVDTINDNRRLGGMFGVYVGCNHDKALEVVSLILKEFNDLKKNGLNPKEFERTKGQLRSQLLRKADSTEEIAHDNGHNRLYFNNLVSLEEAEHQKVEKITNEEIISVANKIFGPTSYVLAIVGKESKLPKEDKFNFTKE